MRDRRRVSRGPRSYVYSGVHPTHAKLIGIWESVLGLRNVGIYDDFVDDLGGDARLRERMLGEVRRVYHLEQEGELEDCRTIAELVDTLIAWMPSTGVVWEKSGGGTSRPLWLLHGDYKGGGLYCRELADYLESTQPFYAVAPRGADGGFAWTIEDMAKDEINLVLDRQSEGPYHLAGYCAGGLVAYEMAVRMTEAGRDVGALLLIDTGYPRGTQGHPRSRRRGNVEAAGGAEPHDWIHYTSAARDYEARRFPGKLGLLCPRERAYRAYDPVGDWRKVAREVDARWIPGGHTTCVTEHVKALASILTECLAASRGGGRVRRAPVVGSGW